MMQRELQLPMRLGPSCLSPFGQEVTFGSKHSSACHNENPVFLGYPPNNSSATLWSVLEIP